MSNRTIQACAQLSLFLPVVFLVAGCASVVLGGPTTSNPEMRARVEIESRLNQVFAACVSKNFDQLESYHLYGPKFTRFSGAVPERLDAAATRKLEHDGLASLVGLAMRADGLKIDVFDNLGIATFVLRYSFHSSGQTLNKAERTTLVFVKVNGDWKITHEHLSPIVNAEPDRPTLGSQPVRPETNGTATAAESPR